MNDHNQTPTELQFTQSEPVKALLLDINCHIAAGALGGNLDLDGVLATLAACHRLLTTEHERANQASWDLRQVSSDLSKARRRAWY